MAVSRTPRWCFKTGMSAFFFAHLDRKRIEIRLLREIHAAQQFLEARVAAQRVERGVYL